MARRRRRKPKGYRLPLEWRLFAAGLLLGGLVVVVLCDWWSHTPTTGGSVRHAPASAYDWTELPAPQFPIPPYARHLRGVRIVLDPGHVGQRDPGGGWKRGPTGLREAEVNLRVAECLRDFLVAAGADVTMTREHDQSLNLPDDDDLRQRAELANECRADLFLSIHHNAASTPEPNYTSVFYHESPEHSRASRAAAMHVAAGLADALRLETQLDCPVLSDRVLHRNGLAVLRGARVPGVLTEASFHSNPEEEARLRDPVYNRREAYGLFLGMARWVQAGLPRVALQQPGDGRVRAGAEVVVRCDDGLRGRGGWGSEQLSLQADTLDVECEGRRLEYEFDRDRQWVRVTLPRGLSPGAATLYVDFENALGQHVLHPQLDLDVVR